MGEADLKSMRKCRLRQRERVAWFMRRRWLVLTSSIAGAAGVVVVTAGPGAGLTYPYDHSVGTPGTTNILTALAMMVAVLLAQAFGFVWNEHLLYDFFGVTTYYGVHDGTIGGGIAVSSG